MASGSGPLAKILILFVCLVLINDAWSDVIGTRHRSLQGSFKYSLQSVEHDVRRDTGDEVRTIENKTISKRALLQRTSQSESEVQPACSLVFVEVERFYDETSRQWLVNDDVLEELDGDLQAIIECANDGDSILFQTNSTIKPTKTLILSSNLTLSTLTEDISRNGTPNSASEMVRFTCPDSGQLLISRSPSLTLANLVVEDCTSTTSVIELSPECDGERITGQARFLNFTMRRNILTGQGHLINAGNASCLQLEMDNVSLRSNRCIGTHCIILSGNNTLNNIQLLRNQGSNDTSLDSSIISAPQGSDTMASSVRSEGNEIRNFQTTNGVLSIGDSQFSNNTRKQLSMTRDNSVGGGVLFSNHSSVAITNTIFERNYATNGGGVFAWSSNITITGCIFRENDAGEGNGGALYGHHNTSFAISSCEFLRNRGYRGPGLNSNHTSRVDIVNSRFSENYSSRSCGVCIYNGTANIRSSEFVQNIADRAAAALCTVTAKVSLKNLTFTGNIASAGSACIFELNSGVHASNLLFENNTAHLSVGGSIQFVLGGRMSIRDSLFQNNYGRADGGAIFAQGGGETVLKRVMFINNTSGYYGGAIRIQSGSFNGSDLTFRRNQATDAGGAISFYATNVASFFRSRFEDNVASGGGAAQFNTRTTVSIDQCVFFRNSGRTMPGGAIQALIESNVRILSSLFRSNISPVIGGSLVIHNRCNFTILNSRFENNTGITGGGAISMTSSSLVLTNSSLLGNRGGFGGALEADASSNFSISRVSFVENYASRGGSLYFVDYVRGTISHSSFANNTAETKGGAITLEDNIEISISNSTLIGNTARGNWGGALSMLDSCNAIVSNCSFNSNTAASRGGAIDINNSSTISISSSNYTGNEATFGGGMTIGNNSTALLISSRFSRNSASNSGGGIYLERSNTFLLGIQLDFNNATLGGSIFAFLSFMEMMNSTITGSHAHRHGGAIYLRGTNARIERTRFESNEALESGGGIYSLLGSHINASNVQVASNIARGVGGGIGILNASSLLCFSCMILNNSAFSGAGLYAFSDNSIPIVAQLENSRFENNYAWSYGGGIEFDAPQNKSARCNALGLTCGHIILLNTSFVDNHANHSGAIVLTVDPTWVLTDCNYAGGKNRDFLSDIEFSSLDIMNTTQLCTSWTNNRLSSNDYGGLVGTYGQEIVLTIDLTDEVKLLGNTSNGYVLENVTSGKQLPIINVTILDGYGKGPAPTVPYSFRAEVSSPNGFVSGIYPRTVAAGFGRFSDIAGFAVPGNYTLEMSFYNQALETIKITVIVRECQIGEESTRDRLTCQECDSVNYNFNPRIPSGCKQCPQNANCTGRYIVPNKGHWHKSPCHDTVQSCLVEEACSYKERHEVLTKFTQNFTDCKINETALDSYNDALCNEGYRGPLCGSCKKSYGLSFRFQCFSCPRRFVSVMTLLGLTLYLLVSSAITIRGTLPSPSIKPKKSSTRGQSSNGPSTSSQDVGIEIENDESLSRESSEDEESGAKCKRIVIRSPPSKPMNGYELLRWKTTEILKILINFLQTTAVAATVNVQWTDGVLEVFEASEYIGVFTTSASSGPIDCLISSDSPKTRSISTMILTLLVPGFVVGIYFTIWSGLTYKNKQNMVYFWKRSFLSIIAVTYISYLGLTQLAVRVFYCVDVYDSVDPFMKTKSKYWAVDTAVTCYGNAHGGLIAIAVILLLFVSVGFPLISALVLTQTKAQDRQSSGWQLETMGFLFRAFKEEFVYWESLVMLRKAFLSVIVVFSYPLGGQIQGLLAAIIIVFSLYFHLICAPFRQEFSRLNYYESISLLVSCVTFILGQFFNAEKSSNTTRVLIAIVIIVANTSFFVCLVLVLLRNVIEQLREYLQNVNVTIAQNAPWWKVLKVFIISKLSAMCCSKK